MSEKYPLLKAWQQGRLREVWEQMCEKLKADDPKLLDWVVQYEAAARVSAHISQEQERLKWDARKRVQRLHYEHQWWEDTKEDHPECVEPAMTDDIIEFHDALQFALDDQTLKSYREILQDLSGNRNMMADEIRYLESIGYQTPEQMEAWLEALG